jgi:rod shape-determining protein MreD
MAWHSGARVVTGVRAGIPVVATVVVILVAALPVDFLRSGMMSFLAALTSVFYWSIYRPDLMPAWAAFSIGIFIDLVSGGPIGLGAIVLLLVHWIAVGQRRALIGKAFPIAWLGYLLISAVACAVYWLIACIYFTSLLSPQPVVAIYMMGIFVYPCAAFLLWRLHVVVGGGWDGS